MIELISDLPPHVAAFRASGKVVKEDYERVVIPRVNAVAKEHGKINFLLLLDTVVSNYSFGAWIDDALVGLKHITHWRKIAIVSRQDLVKRITDTLGHLIPGETKGFKYEDLDIAKNWISA